MTDAPEPGQPPEHPPLSRDRDRDRPVDANASFQEHVRQARSEFEAQVAHARAEFDQANERIKERTGRDLILAILIGLAIGAVVLACLIFLKTLFVLFALAAVGLGVFELCRALQAADRRVDLIPQLVFALLLVVTGYFAEPWVLWVLLFVDLAVIIVWRLVAQMVAADGRSYADVLSDALTGALVQLWVPFLASLAMVLLAQDGGQWWVLAFIIVAVSADVGAYAAGISFGRHPMAPRISPKKTWEGFAGAVAAVFVAGTLLAWLLLGLPWWTGFIIGAALLLTATVGDLGESMLKRDLGIKDMSSWLPGHGGVLDRLDSILPSAAAMLALNLLLAPLGAA